MESEFNHVLFLLEGAFEVSSEQEVVVQLEVFVHQQLKFDSLVATLLLVGEETLMLMITHSYFNLIMELQILPFFVESFLLAGIDFVEIFVVKVIAELVTVV